MQKVIALVVTYNRKQNLQKVINRLFEERVDHTVIVNNASTDNTKEFLESLDREQLKVINLTENLGGAGGFYTGMKFIHEEIKDYDWVVVMDDDAYPGVGTIEYFRNSYKNGGCAYLSAVYYPSGEICEMNRPGYHPFKDMKQILNTFLFGSKGFHVNDSTYSKAKNEEVYFGSFVGYFIHRDIINSVGYPDKKWFIYGDDLDYTSRVSESGIKTYFDPKLEFVHDCMTLHGQKQIYSPLWKAYFTYRNGLMIYKKLSGVIYPVVFLMKISKWFLHVRLYKDKKAYLKITFKAIKDGLLGDRSCKPSDLYLK